MLTVDYEQLGVGPGDLVLDLGCGFGRHAFEAARRGASVVALDAGPDEVAQVRGTFGAMIEAGELSALHPATAVQGDALRLPFADGTFDRVIASEVLEHIPDDVAAMRELARVLKPGGAMAVTVPRWLPRRSIGCSPTSTTTHRAATCASTGAPRWNAGCVMRDLNPRGFITPTACIRPTGGSVSGRTEQRDPSGREGLSPGAGLGHRQSPAGHPDSRPSTEPADRQELGCLPDQARCKGVGTARFPAQRPPWRAGTPRARHADPGSSCMTTEEIRSAQITVPEVSGILTSGDVLATAHAIAEVQRHDGMIPWFEDGHCDPWNHVEAAMALTVCGLVNEAMDAYRWLSSRELPDGSWFNYYQGDTVKDPRLDTNVCAYLAAGAWHHHLITGDVEFLGELWPTIERGIDFILRWQQPDGSVRWSLDSSGRPEAYALLTGSSSIYHSMRCAVAIAECLAKDRPDWELAAGRLGMPWPITRSVRAQGRVRHGLVLPDALGCARG